MRCCSAAALALVGWYLMLPPLRPPQSVRWSDGKAHFDQLPPAPLSQWTIVDSFDSARECRKGRDKLLNDRVLFGSSPKITVNDEIRIEQVYNARCIASDDPRLKK